MKSCKKLGYIYVTVHLIAILIGLTCIIGQAFADCPSNIQKLKTGTSSPCDGFLISEPKMQELAKMADDLELQKKLVLAQDHLQKLTSEEVEHYKRRNLATEKALSQSERQRFWIGVGAFALGVVVTGFAAKAAIEATR